MDYSKTPQKHMTNQKPKIVIEELNWAVKIQDLYFSTLVEIILNSLQCLLLAPSLVSS